MYGYFSSVTKNRRILSLLEEEMVPSEGLWVLDAGCGPGHLSRFLADLCGPQSKVVGLEIDEDTLLRAKRRSRESSFLIRATLDNIPTTPDVFDYVVCISVIEHIPHARRRPVLDEILRTLKPGGRAIFCVPLPLQKLWSLWLVKFHDKHVYNIKLRKSDLLSVSRLLANKRDLLRIPWCLARELFDFMPWAWLRLFSGHRERIIKIKGVCLFSNREPFVRWFEECEKRVSENRILRFLGTSMVIVIEK